jgi:hypothetical protein
MMLLDVKMNWTRPGQPLAPGPAWRLPARRFLSVTSAGRDSVVRGAGILPAALRAGFREKPEPSTTQISFISNRHSKLLETPVTRTKQKIEVVSNRDKIHPVSEANYTVPVSQLS